MQRQWFSENSNRKYLETLIKFASSNHMVWQKNSKNNAYVFEISVKEPHWNCLYQEWVNMIPSSIMFTSVIAIQSWRERFQSHPPVVPDWWFWFWISSFSVMTSGLWLIATTHSPQALWNNRWIKLPNPTSLFLSVGPQFHNLFYP